MSNAKPSRNWCFTCFESTKVFQLSDNIKYIIWQREKCPESGRLHLQGYAEFRKPCRRGQAKDWLGSTSIHLERRRGTRDDAILYCKKSETRDQEGGDAGPWELGVKSRNKSNGTKKMLEKIASDIQRGYNLDEIINLYPVGYIQYTKGIEALYFEKTKRESKKWRKLDVSVYWGPTEIGKTRKAIEENIEDYYILDKANSRNLWFNGYVDQKCLIIDEFYGWIGYSQLLRILDGYQYRAESKFGFKYAFWTKVIITTNKDPDKWYSKTFPNGISAPLLRRINRILRFEWYDDEHSAVTITDLKPSYLNKTSNKNDFSKSLEESELFKDLNSL